MQNPASLGQERQGGFSHKDSQCNGGGPAGNQEARSSEELRTSR